MRVCLRDGTRYGLTHRQAGGVGGGRGGGGVVAVDCYVISVENDDSLVENDDSSGEIVKAPRCL